MDQWYYGINMEQHGPHTAEEMRALRAQGGIDSGTLVWKKGLSDWVAFNNTPLAHAHTPPPIPFSNAPIYQPYAATPKQHSGLGISSFLISILSIIGMFVWFMVIGIMEEANPEVYASEGFDAVIGLSMMLVALLALLAFVFGMVNIFQKNTHRILGILGLVLSSITLLLFALTLILGLLAQDNPDFLT